MFNNVLLSIAAAMVLLGTLYPLLLETVTGEKISVGAPFFNATFVPIMTPVIIAMALGPLMPWKRADLLGVFNKLKKEGLAYGLPATMLVDPEGCLIGVMNGPAEWASEDAVSFIRTAMGAANEET